MVIAVKRGVARMILERLSSIDNVRVGRETVASVLNKRK